MGFKRGMRNVKAVLLSLVRRQAPERKIDLDHRILVGTHHKAGTVWLLTIFRKISEEYGLAFCTGEPEELPDAFDVCFQGHSQFPSKHLEQEYKGIHLIRDPRDVIVSGCFYHQQSKEGWLHVRRPEFGGLTYQEKINSYESLDDKILFEMENAGMYCIQQILDWNYRDPRFLELKYEDLIADDQLMLFHKMFLFLDFPGKTIPQVLKICFENSLFSGGIANSLHIRSGKARQWEKHFLPAHKSRFLELFGDALLTLGYEKDHQWAEKSPPRAVRGGRTTELQILRRAA